MALNDNLIAYWKLDESSGNASDSVGSSTATATGVTYATGKINNGAELLANSKYFRWTANPISDGDLSLSFWIKTSATAGQVYTSSNSAGNKYSKICLNTSGGGTGTSGKISFGRNPGSGWTNVTQSSTINDGNWHHIVVIVSGTSVTIYKDGSADGTGTTTASIGATTETAFGTDSWAAGNDGLSGMIDEFGVWSRVLTSTEVSQLYNSGNGFQYPFTATFIPQIMMS